MHFLPLIIFFKIRFVFMPLQKIAKCDYLLRLVCLSVRMEHLGYNWTDFHGIWYLSIFRKSDEKIQVSLKLDKNKWVLHMKTDRHFWSHVAQFLEWEMRHANVVKKIKTKVLRSITFFSPENRAFFEIIWRNIVEPGRHRRQYIAHAHCMLDT